MGAVRFSLAIILSVTAFCIFPASVFASGYPDAFLRTSFSIPQTKHPQTEVLGMILTRPQTNKPRIREKTYAVQPALSPTPVVWKANPVADKKTVIMAAINAYRASKGLPVVIADPYTCAFAKTRAQEIVTNFSHDGFSQRVQNKTLPYPGYSEVTENVAMAGSYQDIVPMWINSPGHAKNMEADTPYVCVESSGNYYAYEGWRP